MSESISVEHGAKEDGQDEHPSGAAPPGTPLVRAPLITAIVGPTASGKSELGIELAQRTGGEIVNCDSVQVYREINIATAKVPLAERRGVAHHLIDFVSPRVNFTAADWARAAIEKIEAIEGRGHSAILVGGTGLYLRALRRPFFASPSTDETLRARITRIRERRGAEHIHHLLQRFDAVEAARLNPRDWPRVQRALEVRLQTGLPISAQRPVRPEPPALASRLQIIALSPPRQELYARINQRAEMHFANGLVEEVRRLLDEGVPANSNALGAHGYRRVVEYLQGARDLASAIEQTKLDVRHYAKRQWSWFRHEPGVHWLEGFGDDPEVQARAFAMLVEEKE
ncbi:MAG TPA: tRNA (adenosine(37)-N6)-dimethylallyltransferase MiaA [Pyrinomonadaceae bacterium]|nr:tRNA (adenosine(37)-N6)-dimethylallyltransferase MiaA [Pyrinomonadaceae bacterium]